MKKDTAFLSEELERAKEDLTDLKRYLDELSFFLPLAVCTINPLEIIINVNRAFETLSYYKVAEIVGESIEDIFLEKRKFKEFLRELFKKEIIYGRELTLISKEKKEIPVNISGALRRDAKGNFIGYFLTIADITELKKYQEEIEEKVKKRTKELEESKIALMNILKDVKEARRKAEEETEKTLSIIINFTDGLLVFDPEGKLSLINPQIEKFFNIKGKEIMGKTISEISQLPNFKSLVDIIGKEINGVFRKELPIKENLILEVSTIPMAQKGEKFGDLVILHDITREKIVERMKTEFVSVAAHQLRTPLSAIKWTLRMLLDGDLGEITEEQRDFIEKTYLSNERMIKLINDLLNVTRIEEGRYLYKPILIELESVVQSVVNSYKEEIEAKKIKFKFLKPLKKLPLAMIDVEKMSLAIQNLLDNAVKYTPVGGQVTISLKSDKKEIEFSIKDTGVGIPKNQQERVFSKFFRGANAIRIETEGSGLGLYIAKNIIEAHGGKIWFESKEGSGTTFYFTLPVEKNL